MPGLTEAPSGIAVVPIGPGPSYQVPEPSATAPSAPQPALPSLAHLAFGGVNPLPFAVAIVAMGAVMLAFPKAAVPLAIILVLGALLVDRQALNAFQAWQKGH